jgi:hypothetical protein
VFASNVLETKLEIKVVIELIIDFIEAVFTAILNEGECLKKWDSSKLKYI